MAVHKHLIVRAEVNRPITIPEVAENWMEGLIKTIGMKLFRGPISGYVTKEGNKGITCVAIIETSHLALHIWDELSPALVQLDVYSCAEFTPELVFESLDLMEPVKIEYKFLDREENLTEIS